MTRDLAIREITELKKKRVEDLKLHSKILDLIFGGRGILNSPHWNEEYRSHYFSCIGVRSFEKNQNDLDQTCDFYQLETDGFTIKFGFTSAKNWQAVYKTEVVNDDYITLQVKDVGLGVLYFIFNDKLVIQYSITNHSADGYSCPAVTTDSLIKFDDGAWIKSFVSFIEKINAYEKLRFKEYQLDITESLKDSFNINEDEIRRHLKKNKIMGLLRSFKFIPDSLTTLFNELTNTIVGLLIVCVVIGLIIFLLK